jgi:hypothetical protein
VVCKRQARVVAVLLLVRVQGPELQPPHRARPPWVLRPQAVELHLPVLGRRRDRPVLEVAAVGPETSDRRTFHILPVGSGELLLPGRCEADKAR